MCGCSGGRDGVVHGSQGFSNKSHQKHAFTSPTKNLKEFIIDFALPFEKKKGQESGRGVRQVKSERKRVRERER